MGQHLINIPSNQIDRLISHQSNQIYRWENRKIIYFYGPSSIPWQTVSHNQRKKSSQSLSAIWNAGNRYAFRYAFGPGSTGPKCMHPLAWIWLSLRSTACTGNCLGILPGETMGKPGITIPLFSMNLGDPQIYIPMVLFWVEQDCGVSFFLCERELRLKAAVKRCLNCTA